MSNNSILALNYALSEIYMAFSRPEDLATLSWAKLFPQDNYLLRKKPGGFFPHMDKNILEKAKILNL